MEGSTLYYINTLYTCYWLLLYSHCVWFNVHKTTLLTCTAYCLHKVPCVSHLQSCKTCLAPGWMRNMSSEGSIFLTEGEIIANGRWHYQVESMCTADHMTIRILKLYIYATYIICICYCSLLVLS